MTAKDLVIHYLKNRKLPATAKEIATYAKVNYNSVRRVLNEMIGDVVSNADQVKCKIDKAYRTGYSLI